ncbi:hypothetical protein HZC07_01830 [Candidatus Micrarchaeota archaeon]|nr:hypothetical protein [Candidatus Micrarchaeota archaeon]
MGDVKKDVEDLLKMQASGEDSLKASLAINQTIIDLFKQKIKNEFPGISKKELNKKVYEAIFYGRKDNP